MVKSRVSTISPKKLPKFEFRSWIIFLRQLFCYKIYPYLITRRKAGALNYGRRSHRAIFDGEKFLVIGGVKASKGTRRVQNEVCTFKKSTMTCVVQRTALYEYKYPELFLVGRDFGKGVNKC